ncbi:hypothetical protein BN903_39 [Halorubrum sp. AJ67]|nr:hypothetical protein BN903_39 [Halorubrum sp. AJ67]
MLLISLLLLTLGWPVRTTLFYRPISDLFKYDSVRLTSL